MKRNMVIKKKVGDKTKYYYTDIMFTYGSALFYPYVRGYYLICMPCKVKEDVDEDKVSVEDIVSKSDKYEARELLFEISEPNEKALVVAQEVADNYIDVLIMQVEQNIRDEERKEERKRKEIENSMKGLSDSIKNADDNKKENKKSTIEFDFNIGNMFSGFNNTGSNSKFMGRDGENGGIEKCKYYMKPSDVTFDDIAGMEEVKEEVLEAIDLFKNPDKYKEMGIKKRLNNIMLSGASGCGKTLIVKAISNELELPLFSCSGDQSDKYVGTTSRNIETLFNDAKKYAPSIIFIDEFEAMAKTRTGESNNSEREGGVSTLLACLDGLGTSEDVMVIVATNLPDAIDPAVRRRFPTKISITNPDMATRLGILQINAKDMKMEESCNLEKIARNLSGFNGGDIAQIMQSAGMLAVRRGKDKVSQQELEDAMERVIAGLKSKTKKVNEEEKSIIAHHEVGHAIATYFLKDEVIQRISIVPTTGSTLGYVLYANENENDKFLSTKEDLLNSITVSLAGRASEELIFGRVTGGCSNDLEKATSLAEQMVTKLGMCSETFGLMSISSKDMFMRQRVLEEVNMILNNCYKEAIDLLKKHETLLKEMAKVLIEKEVMALADFEDVLNRVEVYE